MESSVELESTVAEQAVLMQLQGAEPQKLISPQVSTAFDFQDSTQANEALPNAQLLAHIVHTAANF